MSDDWLRAFSPDCDELLDQLLPLIDDGMLLEIAGADYGDGVEEHLAPLRLFRDARAVPTLEWHPGEVLELIRWSEPDQADWKPGGQGRHGHLLRAFACSALLRSYALEINHNRWDSFNETAVQLLDSLRALGGGLLPKGAKFFAWCIEVLAPLDEEGSESPFLGLALLSLSIEMATVPDAAIVGLCSWIDAKVKAILSKNQSWLPRSTNFLLSCNSYNQKINCGSGLVANFKSGPIRNRKATGQHGWLSLVTRWREARLRPRDVHHPVLPLGASAVRRRSQRLVSGGRLRQETTPERT